MKLRTQILILIAVLVNVALSAWDGYRMGYKRGCAERLTPQARIEIGPPIRVPEVIPEPLPPEHTDANWRGN